MKRILKAIILSVLIVNFISVSANKNFTVKKNRLKKSISRNKKAIRYADLLLNLNIKNQKITTNKLRIINSKINTRKNLIDNLTLQISNIEAEILEKEVVVEASKKEIENIKEKYSNAIKLAYKYKKNNSNALYILSSETFEQAYRRLIYFKTYSKYRREQAKSLLIKKHKLKFTIHNLTLEKINILDLIDDKSNETYLLKKEQNHKSRYVKSLSKKKKDLEKQIILKQKANIKLEQKINRIIKEEIKQEKERRRRELARIKKNRLKNKKRTKITSFDNFNKLSKEFRKNKGKLIRPIEGIIVSKFGKHKHPLFKKITIQNSGIDIQTKPRSLVKSIFTGVVKKIFFIPGKNQAIIIRHGKYLSVYSNLNKISVRVGDKILGGQTLGQVFTDNGVAIVHIEIWNEMSKQNPEKWINF